MMRNPGRGSFLAILLVTGQIASAQTQLNLKSQSRNVDLSQAGPTSPVQVGSSLPASCTPGQLFFLVNGPPGANLFGCTALNIWTLESSSSSGTGLPAADKSGKLLASNAQLLPAWMDLSAGSGMVKTQTGTAITWSADSTTLPFLALDNAFLGNNTFAGKLTTTPSSVQAVTSSDIVDMYTVALKQIGASMPITMTSTPTIAPGDDGQHSYLVNAGAHNITLQDKTSLAGSALCLAGGANLTLPPNGLAHLVYSAAAGCWIQTGGSGSGGGSGIPSVFGRTGAITAQSGDYTTSEVTEGSNLYFTPARAQSAFTAGTGIALTGGVISATGADMTSVGNSGPSGASVLKTGTNVVARKLIAGSNVTITENTDDITITASGGGGAASGLQREFNAAVCQSSSASLAWNVATASAPIPDCVIGANGIIYGVAKFSNSVTQAMQQSLDLPASVSTITFDVAWRAMTAGGNVVWQLRYLIVNADGTASDDPDLNGSGSVIAAAAAPAVVGKMLKSSASISPSNAGGKRIYFTVYRDNADAGDTFTHATYTPEFAKLTVRVQ